MTRSEPLHTFTWGADSIISLQWNPAETHLLGSTGTDRGIVMYDVRGATPIRKVTLEMRSNKLAWNPREPFNFTVVRPCVASRVAGGVRCMLLAG